MEKIQIYLSNSFKCLNVAYINLLLEKHKKGFLNSFFASFFPFCDVAKMESSKIRFSHN